eukprot:761681_1
MSLLSLLAMLIVTSYSYSLSRVSLQSPSAPYDGGHWITHYDSNTNNIWFLGRQTMTGGSWYIYQQVQTYNIRTDTWNTRPWLSEYLETYGAHASIDNTAYFIAHNTIHGVFSSFNIDTQELLHPHPTISLLHPVIAPCVTTDGRYIYIMGGLVMSTSSYVGYFQIYDTVNNNWFEGLPLNTPRIFSNCEYHDGYIYIFGGQIDGHGHTDSIEMVHVGIGDAVRSTGAFQAWTTLPAVLSSPMRDLSTVMCADVDTDVIYIFGGYDYASPNTHTVDSNIQIFDTTDESIRTASQLNTA